MIDLCFIWIPRTGGTSVSRWLTAHGGLSITKNGVPVETFRQHGIVTFGHRSIDALLEGNVLSRDYYETAVKFAVVRNPWDRLVSNAAWTVWRHRRIGQTLWTIREVVLEMCRVLRENLVPPIDCRTARSVPGAPHIMNTIRPATDWLYSTDGRCHADRILRYERLDEEMSGLAADIGLPSPQLPHANASNHRRYQEYFDRESKAAATVAFERDIDLLKYVF